MTPDEVHEVTNWAQAVRDRLDSLETDLERMEHDVPPEIAGTVGYVGGVAAAAHRVMRELAAALEVLWTIMDKEAQDGPETE